MSDLIDTTEMYLRTIYELEEEGVVPLRARIAGRRVTLRSAPRPVSGGGGTAAFEVVPGRAPSADAPMPHTAADPLPEPSATVDEPEAVTRPNDDLRP